MQGKVEEKIEKIEDAIVESTMWEKFSDFLNLHIDFSDKITVSVRDLIIIVSVIFITTIFL